MLHRHCLIVTLVAAFSCSVRADVVFVDAANCPGPGDGSELDPYCSIQTAIDNAVNTDEIVVAPGTYFETINFLGKAITLRSTNGPEVTTIDAQQTGRVVTCQSGEPPATVLQGFTVRGGNALLGGGMYCLDSSPTVLNCVFTLNHAEMGGGIRTEGTSALYIEDCLFLGNDTVANSALNHVGRQLALVNCTFIGNTAGAAAALILGGLPGADVLVVNCRFFENTGGFLGPVVDGMGSTWINCVFARNSESAPEPATLITVGNSTLTNCTFNDSEGHAISVNSGPITLANCILWDSELPPILGAANVSFSDVQSGAPGTGNIDADPMFVQSGISDLRLSIGSPCVDAGSNAALPADVLDLDGDGNTAEPIPFDIDGSLRVQNGTVDMGASEGEFEPGEPASGTSWLNEGDFVILVPDGGPFDPPQSAAVLVTNISGGDGATFTVTQTASDLHTDALGYSELSEILTTETSMQDGQYAALTFIPFAAADLGGTPPEQLDLTRWDPFVGNWALAVASNVTASPGFDGPVGDRIVSIEGGAWGTTSEPGDYGVAWDPLAQQGFVWANLDYAADFGVGAAFCPADCLQTPDGNVGIVDFLALLAAWGSLAGEPCDLDLDGVVGLGDFMTLLSEWGLCPLPSLPPTSGRPAAASRRELIRSASVTDVTGSNRVSHAKLLAAWGPCTGDCPGDLDGDGVVGVRDLLILQERR